MDLSEMREELFKQDENNKNVILKIIYGKQIKYPNRSY